MRYGFVLAAVLLSGCYASPQDAGYSSYPQPAYSPPPEGYAQPGYPPGVYAPAPYDPNTAAYPGYGYPAGPPPYSDGGPPPVLLGGQWGFYDSGRHWHHAPEGESHRFEEQRREGRWEDHPGRPPHQEGRPFPPNESFRGPGQFHQPEPARPAAIQSPAPRPAAPPPPAARPEPPHERTRFCPTGQHC